MGIAARAMRLLPVSYAGVEALAELSDLVRDALRFYPGLRGETPRWVLVGAAAKILAEIPTRLGEYAAELLSRRGVEIHTATTLEAVEPHAAVLSNGGRILTSTVVWTAGGRIVRADSVRQLSQAGWRALVAHGVRTIVDLRFDEERQDDPPGELPVDVVHVSLFGELDESWWREIDARAGAAGDTVAATRLVYAEALERNHAEVAAAVAAVADARPGAVLVHCVGGKDRTGIVSALLLRLAGVAADDIAADYAQSAEYLAPRHDAWLRGAADDAERERLRRIAATPAESMKLVIESLESRHGSTAAYLRAGGAADETLARARARLLE